MRRLLNFFGLERSGKMPEPDASKLLVQPVWRDGGVSDGDQFESPQAQGWGPMDAASEGSVLLDETGQITEYNARALELLRCALPPESGADFWDAVPEEIAEQHQIATAKALSSSARHAFVVHHKFEGSWVEYSFMRQGAGYVVKLRDVASTQKLLRYKGISNSHLHLTPLGLCTFCRAANRDRLLKLLRCGRWRARLQVLSTGCLTSATTLSATWQKPLPMCCHWTLLRLM